MPAPVKYLNNRDLLKQIHLSKNSYSSFLDTERDHDFDLILHNISDITEETIAEAKTARIAKLQKRGYDDAVRDGTKGKRKQADFAVDPNTIERHDLVFRIMTFDHVPLEKDRKKNPKSTADHHTKLNFPPFQHYKFTPDGELICCGKSHWQGGLSNGQFCKDHGQITRSLALMFMKLCERYGTRSNWRGYTYNDEMRSQALVQLTQIGLQFDESKSQNPFAYYTAAITNSFTRVLNLEKRNQNIRDDILEHHGYNPSYTRTASEGGSNSLFRKE